MARIAFLLGLTSMLSLGINSWASADPLPGEQLKFFQAPLGGAPTPGAGIYPVGASYNPATDSAQPFYGQCVGSTGDGSGISVGDNTMVMDDFGDYNPSQIAHVTWWGAFDAPGVYQTPFLISFFSSDPSNPSTPGGLIASQIVVAGALAPSSGTYTQKMVTTPYSPNGIPAGGISNGNLYEYDAELNWSQIASPDAVYPDVEWIGIQAVSVNPNLTWGWHDRDSGIFDPYANPADGAAPVAGDTYHYLDDAVSEIHGVFTPLSYGIGIDGMSSSMDMSFALYAAPAVPEPTTIGLIVIAAGGLMAHRPKRNRL